MKKISPQTVAHAADLLACNYSARETAKYVGVSERTIRRWTKRPDVAAKIEKEAEEARSLARQQTSFIAAASVDRAVTCLSLLEMCATRPDFALSPARLRCVQAILRESHYWASFLERTEKQRAAQAANNQHAGAVPANDLSVQGSAHEKAAEKRTIPDNKNAEEPNEESVSEGAKTIAQACVNAVPSPEHLEKLLNEIYSGSDNGAAPPNRSAQIKPLSKSA